MSTWTKHRRAEIDRSVDFSGVLNDGEIIASITAIVVTDLNGNDVTSEFGGPTGTINGEMVDFTLGAAQSGEQAGGLYRVLVEIETSDEEPKVSTDENGDVPTLKVSADGEPS